MFQRTVFYHLIGIAVLIFSGCSGGGGTESGQVFVPSSSGHVTNWANIYFVRTDGFHGTAVRGQLADPQAIDSEVNLALCAECHGVDLDGGIALVSCFACHDGPDGQIRSPNHPEEWLNRDDPVHFHGAYAIDYPTACAGICHGDDLTGVVGPSCFECHTVDELASILRAIARADRPPG